MDLLQDPRYKDTPVYLFFEKYIMDVIGELPDDKIEILKNINLQHVFGTKSSAWKDVVTEVLHLSSTINIAVLEQWYKQKEAAILHNTQIDPTQFSRDFVDQYFDENNSLDQWTEETLADAKRFIYENRNLEKV